MEQGGNKKSSNGGAQADASSDLDLDAELEAFVESVSSGADDALADLLDEDELDAVGALVDDPADSTAGAVMLDDGDLEELEAETGPLSLVLDIDGTVVEVDRDRFVIGRVSSLCDVAIVDVNVSREHCAIERRDDDYYLVDCGSINGVTLDGERIDGHRLADGDVLDLSGHTIRVRFAPKGSVNVEPPRPPAPEVVAPAPSAPVGLEPSGAGGPAGDHFADPGPVSAHAPDTAPEHFAPQAPTNLAPPAQPQSFEERVEYQLHQMSARIAQLEAGMQQLLASLAEIKDAAAVARVIRKRLGG